MIFLYPVAQKQIQRVRLQIQPEFFIEIAHKISLIELSGCFLPHFIAAAARRGANPCKKIRGIDMEFITKLSDGGSDNALGATSPSGMNGRNGFRYGIIHQHRLAIGNSY